MRKLVAAAVVGVVACALAAWLLVDTSPPEPEPGPARELSAHPYLNWVPDPVDAADGRGGGKPRARRDGVVVRRPGARDGLRFYGSRPLHEARLIELDGTLVHRWSHRHGQPTPADFKGLPGWADLSGWHHVELDPAGDVIAIVYLRTIMRLGPDSQLRWSVDLQAHHEAALASDGRVYTVASAARRLEDDTLVFDDQIVVLGGDGELERRVSLLDAFQRSPEGAPHLARKLEDVRRGAAEVEALLSSARYRDATPRGQAFLIASSTADLFHTNSIELVTREIPEVAAPGQLLLSMRAQDLIAVLDLEREVITWAWAGPFIWQHHAQFTARDTVLLFDNGGKQRKWSRALELDPRARDIVWRYPPEEGGRPAFYSFIRGAVQELPGGNVLITNSERAEALEVTREGETVWRFVNPDRRGRRRAPIYRVVHVERDALTPGWLGRGVDRPIRGSSVPPATP